MSARTVKGAKADKPKNKPMAGEEPVTKSRRSSTPVQQLALPGPQYQSASLVNGPYIKMASRMGRPSPTGQAKLEFEQAVYDSQVDSDGILRDPNAKEIIDWKPGQLRKGIVDFGHVKGKSIKQFLKSIKMG